MKDSSVNRWLWLIGLVAAALLFVSFGPLSSGSPGGNASGVTVAHWYNTHVNQQWLTVWLVGLALFLLLVYVTQLRAVLVQAGGQRLWPNIVFASGILFVAGDHRGRQLRDDAHPGVAHPRVHRGALRQLLRFEHASCSSSPAWTS